MFDSLAAVSGFISANAFADISSNPLTCTITSLTLNHHTINAPVSGVISFPVTAITFPDGYNKIICSVVVGSQYDPDDYNIYCAVTGAENLFFQTNLTKTTDGAKFLGILGNPSVIDAELAGNCKNNP